jgi:FtsZ-binding cell division protein ZapB
MNKKQIIEAAKSLSIDEITYLQMEFSKLKKVKTESKQRLKRVMHTHSIMMNRKWNGLRDDIHPVCYT